MRTSRWDSFVSDDDKKKPFEKDDIDDIFDLVEESSDFSEEPDEVVLSSEDSDSTPAAVAIAKDEFDEKEISAHIVPIDQNALAAEAASESRRGIVGVILAVLRIPENAIKALFVASPLHSLAKRSKRYREFERNNALSAKLEDKALTPTKKSSRFGLFAANNFLVTCMLLAGLYFGLSYTYTNVLEINSLREVVGLNRVDDGTTTLAEGRQVRSQARFSNRRREAVVRDLDHCSITKFARTEIMQSINSDGRLDNAKLQKSFSAMKRFRETFAGQSLSTALDDARQRRDLVVAQIEPEYRKLLEAVTQAKARRMTVVNKMADTSRTLKAINSKIGSMSIGDVNKTIALRDTIETLNQELVLTPRDDDIRLMDEVLGKLSGALDGGANPLALPETESYRTPEWVFNIAELDNESLAKAVDGFIDESWRYGEKKLRDKRWPVVTYYYGIMTLSANSMIRALQSIDAQPRVAMRQLDRIQRGINQQIDLQFGAEGKQWVNYRGCLNANDALVEKHE